MRFCQDSVVASQMIGGTRLHLSLEKSGSADGMVLMRNRNSGEASHVRQPYPHLGAECADPV